MNSVGGERIDDWCRRCLCCTVYRYEYRLGFCCGCCQAQPSLRLSGQTKSGTGPFEAMRPIACVNNWRAFLPCGCSSLSLSLCQTRGHQGNCAVCQQLHRCVECLVLDTAQNIKKLSINCAGTHSSSSVQPAGTVQGVRLAARSHAQTQITRRRRPLQARRHTPYMAGARRVPRARRRGHAAAGRCHQR